MTVPASTYAPLRLPDSMERADIGPYMRGLREHYGLSQQDVSERLHIRLRYVMAIEASQWSAMPGKVYARGYVHTYAEFLGLDAEQVVGRCFGSEPAREQQTHFVPAPARREARKLPWGWFAGAALLALLLFAISPGSSRHAKEETASAPPASEDVPESIVTSLRTAPLPSPQNIDCLEERSPLGCYDDTRQTRRWIVPPVAPDTATLSAKAIPADD
ncbi:MAG: helix-turn-helix domain-containing protein [Alphaproteobacteria bacterium]